MTDSIYTLSAIIAVGLGLLLNVFVYFLWGAEVQYSLIPVTALVGGTIGVVVNRWLRRKK